MHADEHQSFYKLGLLFLMEVARYVQSTQNRKLVIFLQRVLQLLLCSIVMQNIQIFCGVQPYLLLLVSSHSQTRNFLLEHLNIIIKQQLCGERFPSLLPLLQADVFQCPSSKSKNFVSGLVIQIISPKVLEEDTTILQLKVYINIYCLCDE